MSGIVSQFLAVAAELNQRVEPYTNLIPVSLAILGLIIFTTLSSTYYFRAFKALLSVLKPSPVQKAMKY
jgi:hypothetical protein